MSKGFVFITWGDRKYYQALYNMAFSVKYHSPDAKIFLFHDANFEKSLAPYMREIFDFTETIPEHIIRPQGRIDPANIKLSLYDYLPFDNNMYLDVDQLALSDLSVVMNELIEKGGHYYTHVVSYHKLSQGRDISNMVWAFADDVWEHFNLTDDDVLPAINSSFQFIKKSDESKALFEKAKENYSNPLPLQKLRNQWGGQQPDELYMNVALAQLKVNAKVGREILLMSHVMMPGKLSDLPLKYPILCLFGHKGMIKSRYTDWYDDLLIKWQRIAGGRHIFKWHNIVAAKQANIRPVKFPAAERQSVHNVKPKEKVNPRDLIPLLKWKTPIQILQVA